MVNGSSPLLLKIKFLLTLYKKYIKEFCDRILYLIISLGLCLFIYQEYLHLLIFFKVWSIVIILKYKFTILHILELLYINLILVFYTSALSIYPLLLVQLNYYFKNSLYNYQILFFNKFSRLCCKTISYTLLLYYTILIPLFNYLLIETDLYKNFIHLLQIKIEFHLFSYLTWFIKLKYIFIYIVIYTVTAVKFVNYFININIIYQIFKYYKKLILLTCLFVLFLILPTHVNIQAIIISVSIFILEIFFIYINYKFCLNYK